MKTAAPVFIRYVLSIFSISVVSLSSVLQAHSGEAIGNDPLSPSEQAQIQSLAVSNVRLASAMQSHGGRSALRPGLANVQFLYAELRFADVHVPSDRRRADAYFYDYVTNEAIHEIVNLTDDTVEDVSVSSGLGKQPMATPLETEAVFQILLAHPKFGSSLKTIYAQHHSVPLTTGAQMRAQAGIFFPSSKVGTKLESLTRVCATHRCMQIFLHATDEALVDTNSIVIDLSTGAVIWH